jgi:hydrogenase maturation protease
LNKHAKKIVVFGVGNALMADDGIAEAVLGELERRRIPDNVRLFNAGGDPLRIAQEMAGIDLAIVVDTADMGLSPGKIRTFDTRQAIFPFEPVTLSDHGIGVGRVIEMLRAMGLAERLRIVGVQPFTVGAVPGLSGEMKKRIGEIADTVLGIIRQHRKIETADKGRE